MYAKSVSELAELLGYNRSTVSGWVKRSDSPQYIDGVGYDVDQFALWLKDNTLGRWRKNAPSDEGDDMDEELAEIRKERIVQEVRKLQIHNDMMEKKLINPEEFIKLFGQAVGSINTGFENFIKKSAYTLVNLKTPVEVETVLREEISFLVNQLQAFRFESDEVQAVDGE